MDYATDHTVRILGAAKWRQREHRVARSPERRERAAGREIPGGRAEDVPAVEGCAQVTPHDVGALDQAGLEARWKRDLPCLPNHNAGGL